MPLKVAKRSPIFYELLKIGLNHGTNLKNQTKKIHTFCTNKSRIERHSAMSCLFNRKSTAGRLWLCNDYKISKRLLFEWWMFPSFTQQHCMCRPKKKSWSSKSQTWVQWYFQDQKQFFTRRKLSSLSAGTNCWSSLRSTLHQISRCIRPHRWICICCFQGSQILQRLLLQLSRELCFCSCSWWFLR